MEDLSTTGGQARHVIRDVKSNSSLIDAHSFISPISLRVSSDLARMSDLGGRFSAILGPGPAIVELDTLYQFRIQVRPR